MRVRGYLLRCRFCAAAGAQIIPYNSRQARRPRGFTQTCRCEAGRLSPYSANSRQSVPWGLGGHSSNGRLCCWGCGDKVARLGRQHLHSEQLSPAGGAGGPFTGSTGTSEPADGRSRLRAWVLSAPRERRVQDLGVRNLRLVGFRGFAFSPIHPTP